MATAAYLTVRDLDRTPDHLFVLRQAGGSQIQKRRPKGGNLPTGLFEGVEKSSKDEVGG